MADNAHSIDEESTTSTTTSSQRHEADAPTLRLTVVQYETETDRGTVHPPGLSGIERMETWLSADIDAFVDLREYR